MNAEIAQAECCLNNVLDWYLLTGLTLQWLFWGIMLLLLYMYCLCVSVERSTRFWTLAAAPCWGLKTWRIRVRCWPVRLCWSCWRIRRTEKSATCSSPKACENTHKPLSQRWPCMFACALMALWMFTEAINCAGYMLWLLTAVRDSSRPALTNKVHHMHTLCIIPLSHEFDSEES